MKRTASGVAVVSGDPYRTAAALDCAPDIHSPREMKAEAARRLAIDLAKLDQERPPWWQLSKRRYWRRRARWFAVFHHEDLQKMLDASDKYERAVRADLIGWWPEQRPHSPHRERLFRDHEK